MPAFQKNDLNWSMSPVLLKMFFAGVSSSVGEDKCVLDRHQLIWRKTGEPEVVTTPILTFPRNAIAKPDLIAEMTFAIDADIERLKIDYDRDERILDNPANDHLSFSELKITNPYIVDGISSVDTVYRLTMDDQKIYDLYIMREYLQAHWVSQIENDVRKSFRGSDENQQKVAVLLQPKMSQTHNLE